MSDPVSGSYSVLFVTGSILLIVMMTWRGWRLGIVRQALSIVALGLAYAGAWFLGGTLIPVLRPLGFPDRVLSIFGGVLIGFGIYLGVTILSAVLFKRTSQQSVGVVRFGFGVAGAALGAAFGILVVLVLAVSIRLVGTVAEAENRPALEGEGPSFVGRLREMKRSLEQGPTGALVSKVDPIPEQVYDTLGKVSKLTASPESMDRFASNREVQHVSAHPKILRLQNDPEVSRALREGDFFSLLRHPKIVDAINDPEVHELLDQFDIQKALDHALRTPQKPPAR